MKNSDSKKLFAAMKAEHLIAQEFVEILIREQALLVENDIDPLLLLAEQKSTHALRLNALTEVRIQLLHTQKNDLTNPTILSWLEHDDPECVTLWKAIFALSAQSLQLNKVNGELIQMKLHHNQQQLDALSSAVSQANVYGPDGQTHYSPGSGRSLGNG
ncbi:MAG: flagellar protein FlgN [Gallionella sp.]